MFGVGLPELIIIAIVVIPVVLLVSGMMNLNSKEMFCPNCGTKGKAKRKTKGSILIEIILWICFIVPGIIYTIWRLTNRYYACPACGAEGMIPLDSPRAKQMSAG
jgi:uncharacterized membrane protein YqaE (UPF0057 family)